MNLSGQKHKYSELEKLLNWEKSSVLPDNKLKTRKDTRIKIHKTVAVPMYGYGVMM